MGSNQFGQYFQVTTWGESHGKEVGLVIDGCPPNIKICEEQINDALKKRAPGRTPWTSPRKESDRAEILSGIFEGKTTGHPIAIRIPNLDVRSSAYQGMEKILRPGHANAAYLEKYGIYDYRGGGRASARETACRVAAGAVAEQVLEGVEVVAYLKEAGSVTIGNVDESHLANSPIFCPDPYTEASMISMIERTLEEKDSVGGVVEVIARNLPAGLGDPVYQKLEANLAHAMLSIPASKGFEIGSGFQAARMKGSEHNDLYTSLRKTETNHAGGTLGGISTGMPVICRVAFKPASSIGKAQKTVTIDGEPAIYELPQGSRHDPCVAIRAVPVVRAMMLIVLADRWVKRFDKN
ncbi:chorismate synthase [Waddlia chondrophila 2032/99]|uniref:Chorismate synthase n=2 Tax=Waddlia chondrophila TaxID=71667 RepID=D6YWA2_WADCW|nr:chorismate synthase [Waddlia chondrophila]ADI38413.1 Chorismate synthase [Waddlia chondrophila WSU 86-1044]CCB91498.1 chorismate synthase [Waddlia chondrophila 2032/99]